MPAPCDPSIPRNPGRVTTISPAARRQTWRPRGKRAYRHGHRPPGPTSSEPSHGHSRPWPPNRAGSKSLRRLSAFAVSRVLALCASGAELPPKPRPRQRTSAEEPRPHLQAFRCRRRKHPLSNPPHGQNSTEAAIEPLPRTDYGGAGLQPGRVKDSKQAALARHDSRSRPSLRSLSLRSATPEPADDGRQSDADRRQSPERLKPRRD